MGQFQIRTLLWLTTCAAFGAWLLTLPPRTYGYPFPDGYQVEWLWEFDYFERISFASVIFVAPHAIAWFSRYWEENQAWLRDRFWMAFCGMIVVVTLWLLVGAL